MLKRTALFEEHQKLGGKLVDFGGWELPIQYSGIIDEHQACRQSAGLFDVSHMGEVHVEGGLAESFLNYLVTNQVSKLAIHQAQYTVMCHESGGIVDDLVVYRRAADRFLVVVNASNTEKDFKHILEVRNEFIRAQSISPKEAESQLRISNESSRYTQIAIQGRKAASILQRLTSTDLASIRTYWFQEGTVLNQIPAILARTGYTGEDGFEIYVEWNRGPDVWRALLEVGQADGLKPCGLGARDTLRLEMKYPLYGNELTDQTNPLEAGLGWVVKMDKGDFRGKQALLRSKEAGLKRKLVGFKLLDKGIPRHGYPIFKEGDDGVIGEVTSGTLSPSLQVPIGVAYVDVTQAELGRKISVEIRKNKVLAEVVATPFYKPGQKGL